jgi:nucleoid-associated protein EbfC
MSKGFGQILNQAKKMQERMQKLEQEMETKTIEAQSGGGMVSCVVNGKQDLVSLKISDEIWEERDKEMIEDLIVAAINEGLEKAKDLWKEEMAKITGGMQLPFGM